MPSDPDFPSAGEMRVIYWSALAVGIVVGIASLGWSLFTDSLDDAITLRVIGVLCLIAVAIIFVGQKIVAFFLD